MKKLVIGLILAALVGGGVYYFFFRQNTVEPPQVMQAAVSQGDVTEFVQSTGTLEAQRTVPVGPQVSGTIQWLGADFNSIVKEGQVLARLDPSLLQTQVDIQTANIERQQTDIESQRVQLEDAQRTLSRTKELFEKGLANQTQLEQAELAIKTRQAQIASADKQLVQARANLSQAQLNVAYTEVKSPIDGVVVERLVDIGQSIQSSMNITPFFRIATDLGSLRLTASVDEAEIGKIRRGMDVNFTVDTYGQRQFRGRVETVRLNASTQNNVVTYPVWITVPNEDMALRPGLTATIRIIVNTVSDVVRIPNAALRFRPTAEMFTALGLEPPAQTQGGRGGRGREGAAADQATPTAAPPVAAAAQPPAATARPQQAAAPQQAASAAPQGATGDTGRRGGRGNFANLSPEERARFMEMGGRNGGPGRGRGAGANAQAGGPGAAAATQRPAGSTVIQSGPKIDEMLAPLPVRPTPQQVWLWDATAKTLTSHRLMAGISDGQVTQMISGELKPEQQVVTNILLPAAPGAQPQQQQNIFNQGRGGFGGGGFGGGGRGGGRGGF